MAVPKVLKAKLPRSVDRPASQESSTFPSTRELMTPVQGRRCAVCVMVVNTGKIDLVAGKLLISDC